MSSPPHTMDAICVRLQSRFWIMFEAAPDVVFFFLSFLYNLVLFLRVNKKNDAYGGVHGFLFTRYPSTV